MESEKTVLGKGYEPAPIEDKWYMRWVEEGLFKADPSSSKPHYSIVIPPPNVTGSLHVGHALDNTLQDMEDEWRTSVTVADNPSASKSAGCK